MKKTVLLMSAALLAGTCLQAQQVKEEKKTVKVTVQADGNGKTVTVNGKPIDVKGMNDEQINAHINVIIDSTHKGDKRKIIRIDQNTQSDYNESFDFKFDENVRPRMQKQLRDLNGRVDRTMNRVFYLNNSNGSPASVRNLDAYPNNPDKNELNVRFHAPKKGDVVISVMDTKGKQVARKEVKDFEGDYVGQIDLDKNAKGTFFITVVQNEDGATKRIVIQ